MREGKKKRTTQSVAYIVHVLSVLGRVLFWRHRAAMGDLPRQNGETVRLYHESQRWLE